MTAPVRKRGFLLNLAAEGIAPAIAGCAKALAGGPIAGVVGVVAPVVERAINLFGQRIVHAWLDWMRGQPRVLQLTAITELADLAADRARQDVIAAVDQLAPEAALEDRAVAVEYLSALPRSVQRSLVLDPVTGGLTLPAAETPDNPRSLLHLLPVDVPPYPPHSSLPGTPYQLGELAGAGGFGIVYKATAPSLQHLTFALKFCLDRSMVVLLQHERQNLERLIAASQGKWTDRIVRLYGYDLDHPTPFLVYEYVAGGDLTALLTNLKQQTGRGFAPGEVLKVVEPIAEALAFAHARGLVHRDLKPANVLVSGDALKLADFGIGGVVAGHAAQHSRIGSAGVDPLTSAEQVSLLRGAGTPLYMSPEQRRGEPADPRHDLYSLGVLWYQLLIGDVTRELHPGWAKELSVQIATPPPQVALIERCVGWFDDRPRDGGELLRLMKTETSASAPPTHALAATALTPEEVRITRLRQQRLLSELKGLLAAQQALREQQQRGIPIAVPVILLGSLVVLGAEGVLSFKEGQFFFSWLLLAALAGLLGALLVLFVALRFLRLRLDRLREETSRRADHLAVGYPDEVEAWGSNQVLHNVDVLREIVDALEADTPAL